VFYISQSLLNLGSAVIGFALLFIFIASVQWHLKSVSDILYLIHKPKHFSKKQFFNVPQIDLIHLPTTIPPHNFAFYKAFLSFRRSEIHCFVISRSRRLLIIYESGIMISTAQ